MPALLLANLLARRQETRKHGTPRSPHGLGSCGSAPQGEALSLSEGFSQMFKSLSSAVYYLSGR